MGTNYHVLRRNFGVCMYPRCTRDASVGGYCEPHKATLKRRQTTDGVLTGPRRKLTDEQVAEARRLRSAFWSMRAIAQRFGVHEATIRNYLRKSS